MKLSDLKNQNKLLFDYFKNNGFNENSYVYSTDIEKLKEAYDKMITGNFQKKKPVQFSEKMFQDAILKKQSKLLM